MAHRVFGGVDVGKDWHFPCVLDLQEGLLTFPERALDAEEVTRWLAGWKATSVAIDSPPAPNKGVLRSLLPAGTTSQSDRRVSEFCLNISGCYATPSRKPTSGEARAWMASGMELFSTLSSTLGMKVDLGSGEGELIETHPTYAFKALIGHTTATRDPLARIKCDPQSRLRPKRTLAGHGQRIQLLEAALQEIGVKVSDAVRQKWNIIDWVDTTVCALVAAWRQLYRNQARPVGDAR